MQFIENGTFTEDVKNCSMSDEHHKLQVWRGSAPDCGDVIQETAAREKCAGDREAKSQ